MENTISITDRLLALAEPAYTDFESRLVPGLPRDRFLGVRVPLLRKLAKEISPADADRFLRALPHRLYDENMLHAILLSDIRETDECVRALNAFLPYVDNWAVCDTLIPRPFKKRPPGLERLAREWIGSQHAFTCRFGIGILLRFALDAPFDPGLLELPARVRSDEYYVNMMVAWFFAAALDKQWDAALPYLTGCRLDTWVHNKTIQKACESFRVPPERKEYLKTLKIRK